MALCILNLSHLKHTVLLLLSLKQMLCLVIVGLQSLLTQAVIFKIANFETLMFQGTFC